MVQTNQYEYKEESTWDISSTSIERDVLCLVTSSKEKTDWQWRII